MMHPSALLNTSLKLQPIVLNVSFPEAAAVPSEREARLNEQVSAVLAGSAPAALPDGSKLELPYAGVFDVSIAQVGARAEITLTPLEAPVQALAVRFCQAVAALPEKLAKQGKKLPRSQRMGAALLAKLPPEPTGNVTVDRGRSIVLNQTANTLMPGLVKALTWSLNRRLEDAALV